MKFEEMKKEDLVNYCKKCDEARNWLNSENFRLRENEQINLDILKENVQIKERNEYLEHKLDEQSIIINGLNEQLDTYKNCLNAIAKIRGE